MIFVFEVAYRPDGPGVRFFIRSNIIIFASQGFLIRTASQKNPRVFLRSGADQKPLASEDGILYTTVFITYCEHACTCTCHYK